MNTAMLQKAILVSSVCLMAQAALGAIQEVAVTTATGDQQTPAVWQAKIAWEDRQSGSWDISYKDLSANPSFDRSVGTSGEDKSPAIWANILVWQTRLPGRQDWDIRGADLTNSDFPAQFWIANWQLDQTRPKIWGNRVAYEDNFWGFWMLTVADISDPYYFNYSYFGAQGVDAQYAAIWGDLLIFQTNYSGSWDIDAADASDPNRLYGWVYAVENDQQHPTVYGNWVVWEDDYAGDWDVVAQNTSDALSWYDPICVREGSNASSPALWNNVVVWQDDRNGNWDIYGYNLATKEEFRITPNAGNQTNPAISFSESLDKYVVVWQDDRHGNSDIYAALIDGVEAAGCISPLKWDVNADAVVDSRDLEEIQQHLGERNGISP